MLELRVLIAMKARVATDMRNTDNLMKAIRDGRVEVMRMKMVRMVRMAERAERAKRAKRANRSTR